jgi:hypothetical protein
MGDWTNYGIVGDVKDVENLAVGPNSRIDVTKVPRSLREGMQALTQAVDGFNGPEAVRAELLAAHRDVFDELNAPDPDKGKVLSRLSQLARAAGTATSVVTAVTALANAVQLVL